MKKYRHSKKLDKEIDNMQRIMQKWKLLFEDCKEVLTNKQMRKKSKTYFQRKKKLKEERVNEWKQERKKKKKWNKAWKKIARIKMKIRIRANNHDKKN